MVFAWVDCRVDEVSLSRKGAKSRTHSRKLRSTGTKARTRVPRFAEPRTELEKKLTAHTRELEKKLEARTRALSEALEQQTATSEVLGVISSSPGELNPVFEAMLENATRICEAKFGTLSLYEGDGFRVTSLRNAPQPSAEERRRNPVIHPGPGHILSRVVQTKQIVHIADVAAEEGATIVLARLAGARTVLGVPMLKDN